MIVFLVAILQANDKQDTAIFSTREKAREWRELYPDAQFSFIREHVIDIPEAVNLSAETKQ